MDALAEWYDRERVYVEDAIDTANYFQLALPGESVDEWWTDFWNLLESRVAERGDFLEAWRYDHGDLEFDSEDDEEGVETRHPDSLSELFCESCETFQFRLYGKGEAAYCADCFEELGMETQTGLSGYTESKRSEGATYALVGCGASKKDGRHEAPDLYVSPYFKKKARFAAERCDEWVIVSAKHGLIEPEEEVREHDTEISDVKVGRWLDEIAAPLEKYLEGVQEVWVLIGEAYLSAEDASGRRLEHVLTTAAGDATVWYPFRQTDGIGEQQRWLTSCVDQDEAIMPYQLWESGQRSLDQY